MISAIADGRHGRMRSHRWGRADAACVARSRHCSGGDRDFRTIAAASKMAARIRAPCDGSPLEGERSMKLYYHPVSTVSRPVVLFAADSGIPLDYQVVDLMKGEHMQEAYGADQPEPPRPRAQGRRFPADRELGDPQVPRRQGRLAGLPEGPAEARARQRDDGLAQHRLLPRLRLRSRLPADLSASQAAERGSARRDHPVGQGADEVLAEGPRPGTCSAPARNTCAATTSRLPTISAREWSRSPK